MVDGTPIMRPCVEVTTGSWGVAHVGVVDSGSPITVADPAFPFAILLGQRGWFDRFPTTIDATHTVVHLPN